jgi:hypothetical protein
VRAFRFFALFSALFVVYMRCSSGLPLALVCNYALPESAHVVCPGSEEPASEDSLAPVAVDDDSDDDADPLLSARAVEVTLLTFAEPASKLRGTLASELALTSHARSLERPPRA